VQSTLEGCPHSMASYGDFEVKCSIPGWMKRSPVQETIQWLNALRNGAGSHMSTGK
jgi:hypothetical protein